MEDQLKSLAPVTFIPGVFLWRVCGNHEHFLFNAFGCIVLPRLAAEYSFRESVCGIYREYLTVFPLYLQLPLLARTSGCGGPEFTFT